MAEEKKAASAKSKSAAERQKKHAEQIQEQLEAAQKRRQERQFLEELAKRVSIAREGRALIERKNFAGAMQAYRRFLLLTAKAMELEIEDLTPTKFDEKHRVSESLLASQIFFDLLRMLDKVDNEGAAEERRLYHKLFIRFTKGMPFQHFAAENLRKHLTHETAIRHKKEFWATYKALEVKGFCIVASWAFDSRSAPEVERLRRFRDEVLWPRPWGRRFIRAYYRHGIGLAEALARVPGARPLVRRALGAAVRALGSN